VERLLILQTALSEYNLRKPPVNVEPAHNLPFRFFLQGHRWFSLFEPEHQRTFQARLFE
jgi:hypothetical protein